jgi:hypothetical protein
MYGFYMDVHTRELRLRGVQVFTAQDEGAGEDSDELRVERKD